MSSPATNTLPGTADRASLRDRLAGPVASIGLGLIIVIAVGLIWVGPKFLSASNITIIGNVVAPTMLVAAFAGFALLAGVVDLSIGSMLGLSSVLTALFMSQGWPLALVIPVVLLICAAVGSINAVAVVIFRADTIAATLGMLVGLRGVIYILTGGVGSVSAFDLGFYSFANATIGPLPLLLVIALAVMALATFIVTRTRIGRHVQAVGGDPLAASRAGIPVARTRFVALILSAVGAGIGGIVYVGQLGSASNYTGTGLEFQVYAAMMIGGYSILRGGVGNPLGGALGLLVVAGTSNIVDLKAISPYYVDIIVGLLLLAAVLLDRIRGGDAFE